MKNLNNILFLTDWFFFFLIYLTSASFRYQGLSPTPGDELPPTRKFCRISSRKKSRDLLLA